MLMPKPRSGDFKFLTFDISLIMSVVLKETEAVKRSTGRRSRLKHRKTEADQRRQTLESACFSNAT